MCFINIVIIIILFGLNLIYVRKSFVLRSLFCISRFQRYRIFNCFEANLQGNFFFLVPNLLKYV